MLLRCIYNTQTHSKDSYILGKKKKNKDGRFRKKYNTFGKFNIMGLIELFLINSNMFGLFF